MIENKSFKKIIRCVAAVLLVMSLSSCNIIIINHPDGTSTSETTGHGDSSDTAVPGTIDDHGSSYKPPVVDYNAKIAGYFDSIPGKNCDGSSFLIISSDTELVTPGATADYVASAVAKRNELLSEKYNVKIVSTQVNADTYFDDLSAAIKSGDYYADLVMVPQKLVGQFGLSNMLVNLRSVPYITLDGEYLNQSSREAASAGYYTYAIAGNGSVNPNQLSTVYFNRTMFEKYDLALPYESVYTGNWCWTDFLELTAAVNGINETRAENGLSAVYSYTSQNSFNELADLAFISTGNHYYKSGAPMTPVVNYTFESVSAVVDLISGFLNDKNAYQGADGAITAFYHGESLFLIDKLFAASWIAGGKDAWGILPMPKNDPSDSGYKTSASPDALMFAAPANVVDIETSGIIMCAINAASTGKIAEAYVKNSMYKTLRDNDSVNVLEILCSTETFDFSGVFGNVYSEIQGAASGLIYDADTTWSFENLCNERIWRANSRLSALFPVS